MVDYSGRGRKGSRFVTPLEIGEYKEVGWKGSMAVNVIG